MLIHLAELPAATRQQWLQHAIAPRPIALVSSVNKKGEANLAPFSFFNMVSTEPPLVVFSPARRLRDGSTKHTFGNVLETGQAVIHMVTHGMLQQVSLASCEYPAGVDEFVKAGFTKEPATMVTPPMVKESPVKFECKIIKVESLGGAGGAGNLVIAELLCMHVSDEVLNAEKTMIDQQKTALVARLGGDWYCCVEPANLFKVPKPNTKPGMGFDALPAGIRNSDVLTGNHLAQLANFETVPVRNETYTHELLNLRLRTVENIAQRKKLLRAEAVQLLEEGRAPEAWQVLLME
ncbi:flavin reductase family protein [Agriterribacter sp.]|uniref:flavin reductase family protein n=1 Tax=Agriterribacter sp. TaxID=2821509 RepID=UPI002CA6A342|nr:flavin reductase family protein [Agriterribacter sp.]HRP57931.1 flavin reductase family protein [Agriterribacter sp.]